MVAFQPIFKLMLVSLNLVVFLGLQTTSVVANSHDGSAPVDNAIRRHAARAGRLSKRFPPVSGTNTPTLKRKQRHHRFGLTPAQIEELLNEEEIEDSDLYVPASNSTNTTSTSHHAHHRTRPATDSKESTGTAFPSFALPTSNSTSTSNTTSSAATPSVAPTSHSHSTFLHNSTASANSSDADNAPPSRTASSSVPTSTTSKDDNDSSSDDTQPIHTSASRSSDGLGGLLGPLLSPSSTSASQAAQQTSGSQQGSTGSSDDDDDQDSTGHPPSRASSPSATSSSASPASTSSQASNNNDDDDSEDTPVSSSHSTKTTQPDFYSFRPQPTSSSTQAAPSSSTSGGLLHGILPGLGHLLSASDAATATPAPTASPSDSNIGGSSASNTGADANSNISSSKDSSNGADPTDGSSDQSLTSTSNSASSTTTADESAPTDSAGGSDGTTSQTSTATSTDDRTTSQTSTVTASPTSTSQGSVTAPTGTNTGNGSDSVSSADHQSSSASNTAAHAPTSTASNSSDSGNGSGSGSASASQSATSTTNPYWYANTRSLNLAPSSTYSAEQPKETASQSTDSDSSTNTHNHPDSSTAWLPGSDNNTPSTASPQDLPTTIVPSADSYDQPDNTTSIGLLFKQDMKWTWVISQADLTAQVFAFMPELVGQAVSLDASKISTVKLVSYSPETGDAATTGTLTTARTLYMAYVPTENVEDIQAMVSNVSSPFYTSAAAGAPQQLASQVDPTFNILSAAGQVAASAQQKSTSGRSDGKDESKIRNSLIGVGCGLAGFFAIAVGGLLWRKQRKDKVEAAASGNNGGGISRAHTIRSFSGGLRETWAPDALDQHRALATAGEMQQVWTPHDPGMGMAFGHPAQPMQSHADGFGGYVATDPFHDAANINAAGGYVNMNRSSRMTERSTYSDVSQMTEAQRIQYDYESSRRSFHSTSDHSNSHGSHSEHSTESAGMLSTYQDDYRVPRQHTTIHTFGTTPPPRSNSVNRTRRRGSVASSTIGRPEMMSNSVLL
ncbi:probable transmembrane mucin involved in surface sensing via MAP-kinase cascade [Ustilago sp. UG-2017b]|nr:probable transmembrane mucin involved in surface sensing via MAP-kinase cascade [Ustilago sp. UG-2017b]